VQFADLKGMLLFGSIGIGLLAQCRSCGSVMNIGGILLQINHDCHVCSSLIEEFGTCEYMHQANPSKCVCRFTVKPEKKSVQTVLETASTLRTRLAYWRHWSLTEGVKLGLTVPLEERRPNLPKFAHNDEE
jgi:hypothetical protein